MFLDRQTRIDSITGNEPLVNVVVKVEAPILLPALVGDDLLGPVAVDVDSIEHVLVQLVPLLQLPL